MKESGPAKLFLHGTYDVRLKDDGSIWCGGGIEKYFAIVKQNAAGDCFLAAVKHFSENVS